MFTTAVGKIRLDSGDDEEFFSPDSVYQCFRIQMDLPNNSADIRTYVYYRHTVNTH